MLNKIVVMGRFTADAELRSTQGGKNVTSFTLAVNRDFKGQNGERETDFINCVAWNGTADFVTRYFKKGSMAIVSGRLQTRNYETTDGQKRTATEIVAENVYFGESKRDTAESETADSGFPSTLPSEFNAEEDDDLPF
jgi:single-strand DNA-binding protein